MKILLFGANGKMGERVKIVAKQQNIEVVSIDVNNRKKLATKNAKSCNVAIDFSNKDALIDNIEFCVNNKINLVVATTGHNQQNLQSIKDATSKIAIFMSSNLSIGFNKMLNAIKFLDQKDCDVGVIEQHHIHKKDNPSGSALQIKNILSKNHTNIQIFGIRGGEDVGSHSVIFYYGSEKITITHEALSRDVFSVGAINCAKFIMDKNSGLFNMQNLV